MKIDNLYINSLIQIIENLIKSFNMFDSEIDSKF